MLSHQSVKSRIAMYYLFLLAIIFKPTLALAEINKMLRVTLQSSAILLDPGGIQDSQSWIVSRQVNCQLVRNQGGAYYLDAAESIKYITPLKILIKIKNSASFHDGSSVTAADVIASLTYIKESRNILSNLFTWINKIEIIDNNTISISLRQHVPQLLKVLSSANYTIYKKSFLINAKKNKDLWEKPLGCGSYKIVEFNKNDIKLIPVRRGIPIMFYLIQNNQINANQLKNYDIVTVNIIGKSKEINNFNVLETFDPIQYYIGLNSKSMFWKNKQDRCHFLGKINEKNLLSSYGSSAIAANDFLPKGVLGYNINHNFDYPKNYSSENDAKFTQKHRNFCLSYLTVSIQEEHKHTFFDMIEKITLICK